MWMPSRSRSLTFGGAQSRFEMIVGPFAAGCAGTCAYGSSAGPRKNLTPAEPCFLWAAGARLSRATATILARVSRI